MELVTPGLWHKQDAFAYRQEHVDCGEGHIHGSGGLMKAADYESWLAKVTTAQTAAQAGWVNCSTYFAFTGGRLVGTVQIRHTLNDFLLFSGGHIGYGVRPAERRKGYAAAMLSLALGRCGPLGITAALVTCDKMNIGSQKTILKSGGVLENEVKEPDGNVVLRYWIKIEDG